MLTVDLTKEFDLIDKIMTDPVLFNAAMTDNEIEQLKGNTWTSAKEGHHYLLLRLDNEPIGVVRFSFITPITIDYHWHLLPSYWGSGLSDNFSRLVDQWFIDNTEIQKIVVQTPKCCQQIIKAAHRDGFVLEGVLTKAIVWRGDLEDLVLMSRQLNRM